MTRSIHLLAIILASGAAAPALAQVTVSGKPYTKLATRAETRQAMLAKITGVAAVWGPWSVLSPIDHPDGGKNIDKAYPPEDELARMGPGGPGPEADHEYQGKDGKPIKWRHVEEKQDIGGNGGPLPIDIAEGLGKDLAKNAVGYIHRSINADKARDLPVWVGSDDGLRLWFNGELLIDDNAEQSLDPRAHRLVLHLKPGVNHVLAKVSQGTGEWQFQLTEQRELDPYAEAALDYQLDSDFPDGEAKYYRIVTAPQPKGVVLEVGGIDLLPPRGAGDLGRPIVCTRRGDVYIVDGAYDVPMLNTRYTLFASGLQEPLGLRVLPPRPELPRSTRIVLAQRSELTELTDSDGAGAADSFRTICAEWKITGNYHEYAFGPKLDRAGNFWVTLNLAHTGGETTMGATAPTRGWVVRIDPATGKMTKIADGLRSPDGIGMYSDGEMFYTDNQGDYVATNKLCHLKEGTFYGHQASLKFRDGYGPDWKKNGKPVPEITWPAVWLPYKKMGQSTSDILLDDTGGKFGPFAGQLFVGDQTYASVYRIFLEKVTGPDGVTEYQGACFPFKTGFASGMHRMIFAPPDATGRASMFLGMTDRGWGSTGPKREGLQRLVWTGEVPFEILAMRIKPDGYEIDFTKDLGPEADAARSYRLTSYTYEYHPDYGSSEMDTQEAAVQGVERTGPRSVRLHLGQLRSGGVGYVYELHADGVRSAAAEGGVALLHPEAYYTVQRAPASEGGR